MKPIPTASLDTYIGINALNLLYSNFTPFSFFIVDILYNRRVSISFSPVSDARERTWTNLDNDTKTQPQTMAAKTDPPLPPAIMVYLLLPMNQMAWGCIGLGEAILSISKTLSLDYIITNIRSNYESVITSQIHQPIIVNMLAHTMAAATPIGCITSKCIKQWITKKVLLSINLNPSISSSILGWVSN